MYLAIRRLVKFGQFRYESKMNTTIPFGILILFLVASFVVFSFLALPILMIFFSFTFEGFMEAIKGPHLLSSLSLSILTTTISALIITLFGIPIAYLLARYTFPFKNIISIIIDLPMVIPPSVAGIGLLVAFGRRSEIGSLLNEFGISISFTMVAVIFAQLFISAPFFIRTAKMGFTVANQELEGMARSLGAGWWRTFTKITLPLAKPYLISGLLTCWARALGEFGATIMFAGNFLGKTETMPLAIYSAMSEDMDVAIVLAIILVAISIALMTTVKLIPLRNDLL